ncbi:PREDICTED: angiopoietin-related protein 5-like [Thamnophis sirtalis]|uniref:Angiopoietin-related protein 5-like n=1 Tax=Thamnophis sirtalis TaxID=35019 RepID=A0A6I9X730_9SAUR|nr:PREDICTED: angiopoietin-related protein 5-like [Thamnophis sirtalis]
MIYPNRSTSLIFLNIIFLIWADSIVHSVEPCSATGNSTATVVMESASLITKNLSTDNLEKKKSEASSDSQPKLLREEKHYMCRKLQNSLIEYARSTKKMIRNMMDDHQSSLDYLSNQNSTLVHAFIAG